MKSDCRLVRRFVIYRIPISATMDPNDSIEFLEVLPENSMANTQGPRSKSTKIVIYRCAFEGCSYSCERLDNFNRHQLVHSGTQIQCSNCKKLLSPMTSLKHHMNSKECVLKTQMKLANQIPENPSSNQSNDASDNEVEIKTKIKVVGDGSVQITQNPVKIGDKYLVLVPHWIADGTDQNSIDINSNIE